MRDLTPLCLLAKKHMTDKGGRHNLYDGNYTTICHEYTPVYHDIFGDIRENIKSVLEIGVLAGCSLRMWEEYFPNAEIIGVDIEQYIYRASDRRLQVVYGDQGSVHSLREAASRCGFAPFDLIIDDGSHHPTHQKNSIHALLPFLRDGGYYVCEDIHVDVQELIDAIPPGFDYTVPETDPGINCANEKLLVIKHG